MDNYAFGIDVDGYNGVINWPVIKEKLNPKFVGVRAVLGYGGIDKFVKLNLQGAADIGARVFAYGVFFPEFPVKLQADHFVDTVGSVSGWSGIIPVGDFELNNAGLDRSTVTGRMIEYGQRVAEAVKHGFVDYSRGTWIDKHTVVGSWRNSRKWWLAGYLNDRTVEKAPPPRLPAGVTSWLIHQTADKVAPPAGCMQGTTVDTNRWNGTADQVDQFFDRMLGVVTGPEDPLAGHTETEAVRRLCELHPEMWGVIP